MNNIIKHFNLNFNQKTFLTVCNFLIFIFCLYLVVPSFTYVIFDVGLDLSANLAVNMALIKHFVFGRDIIFTYGPLSFLDTGVTSRIFKPYIILFIIFITACLAFIIHSFLKNLSSIKAQLIFTIIILFTCVFIYSDMSNLLFFIFAFFLFHFIQKNNNISVIIASLVGLTSFYIKLNTGLLMMILLYVVLILQICKSLGFIGLI